MKTYFDELIALAEKFRAEWPRRIRRTSIPIQDEVTSEEVLIVSDDMTVKAKPAKESADGNQ